MSDHELPDESLDPALRRLFRRLREAARARGGAVVSAIPPLSAAESADLLRRVRERVVPLVRSPHQTVDLHARATTLIGISPAKRWSRLAKEPELASPLVAGALLDCARAALAAPTELSPAALDPPPVSEGGGGDRAALLAEIATEVAYRIHPVLYPVTARVDALAEAQGVLALSHLAAGRALDAAHAMALAAALRPQGGGDPLLAGEILSTEGILECARGDRPSARRLLRSAIDHFESCEERDGATVARFLLVRASEAGRGPVEAPAIRARPQARVFDHLLSTFERVRRRQSLASTGASAVIGLP